MINFVVNRIAALFSSSQNNFKLNDVIELKCQFVDA